MVFLPMGMATCCRGWSVFLFLFYKSHIPIGVWQLIVTELSSAFATLFCGLHTSKFGLACTDRRSQAACRFMWYPRGHRISVSVEASVDPCLCSKWSADFGHFCHFLAILMSSLVQGWTRPNVALSSLVQRCLWPVSLVCPSACKVSVMPRVDPK